MLHAIVESPVLPAAGITAVVVVVSVMPAAGEWHPAAQHRVIRHQLDNANQHCGSRGDSRRHLGLRRTNRWSRERRDGARLGLGHNGRFHFLGWHHDGNRGRNYLPRDGNGAV
jgi:hypothetical protein